MIEWRVRAEAEPRFTEVHSGMRAFRAGLRKRKEMVDLHVRIEDGRLRVHAAVRAPADDPDAANEICRAAVAASLAAAGVRDAPIHTEAWPAGTGEVDI